MGLKPWREVAVPHEDVLKGTFQQAEFAADLSRVHDGTATAEYQNPVLFFQRTFITEGMRLLLESVVKRLSGRGGDPVIQLQTAFGGGKTHTMLAVYHLAKGEALARDLSGVSAILDASGITELPRARIAVLDGIKSSPNQPAVRDGQQVRTLWGDLAWQLGKAEGYALVADADASGTSPGKAVLEALLNRFAPCVILIDELVAYVRQFEEGRILTGGSFDSNLSFVQALTEALKAVPTAVMLASLPESDKEAGSQRGVKALAALSHYFGRIQALWKPVGTEEAFEIVRRRLFSVINDKLAAESVCRAFADYYTANGDAFPRETQEGRYFERMMHAYPIHPEVFDRLYEDWSSLDNFQRTRGVLKLMAKVIHRLWKANDRDPLIMPGSFPLADGDTRNDIIYYLPQGWDPVVERDVDGERAETTEIESQDTRLGSVQACRRAARTIFLGSAPSTPNQVVRGIELERVALGAAQPGQQVGIYKDALRRLNDRLHYLNSGSNRFWFDTRPNLRREMEDRKRRFQDKEDVFPAIRDRLQRSIASGVFGGIHVFTASGDVPDDWQLRLVVLPPDAAFSRSDQSLAIERATEILRRRGEQPRFKQNRLIFLAADYDNVARLKDQVRSVLAWQSIVNDIKEMKLNLDQFQSRQASKSLEDVNEALRRMIRETYKWVMAPMQEGRPGRGLSEIVWEHFPVNPGAQNLSQEIERVLKENELLITEWAPIHLAGILKNWFWKDEVRDISAVSVWQQSCQQLYLPRLKDDTVFQATMAAGAASRDFFGFAYGKGDGQYIGFSYGRQTSLIMDTSLLLVEPAAAAGFAKAQQAAEEVAQRHESGHPSGVTDSTSSVQQIEESIRPKGLTGGGTIPLSVKKQFYGNIAIDAIQAKKQFADIVDEVVLQFTSRPGVKVNIAIEIRAEAEAGFEDGVQRAVKENCRVLRFTNAEFEE
ncbi:putative AAA+ superfamily ATPase [Paraburkholderia youngii]|uniref:ATP-binding protein n=1 Tax=Paraburkholderia youngii TaxID=2782701 RepID=UPI003D24F6F9